MPVLQCLRGDAFVSSYVLTDAYIVNFFQHHKNGFIDRNRRLPLLSSFILGLWLAIASCRYPIESRQMRNARYLIFTGDFHTY